MTDKNLGTAKNVVVNSFSGIDRIALIDFMVGFSEDRFDSAEKLSDLSSLQYLNVNRTEAFNDLVQYWDWTAVRTRIFEENGKKILAIGITQPAISIKGNDELKAKCTDYIWTFDLTKQQSIVFYYRHDCALTYGLIGDYLGIRPQSVKNIYDAAYKKVFGGSSK